MTDEPSFTAAEWHTKCAKELFNFTWTLIDKPDRTPDEDELMLHAAHGSTCHWKQIGTEVNQARGHWIISRVNVILKRPEAALHHAQLCLDKCQGHGYGDWDLAFAFEALARAHLVADNKSQARRNYEKAVEAGKFIKDDEDRAHFEKELQDIVDSLAH